MFIKVDVIMKILNFGSLNIDFVYSVEHFVKAGETLGSTKLDKFCGGKGLNQSVALSRAGANVFHAGCVGTDGGMLLNILQKNKVNTDFVQMVNSASGHAIIQVDQKGQNCILLYSGANHTISTEQIDQVFVQFTSDDVLLLQNEINNLEYIITKAHSLGMKIALNPSPVDSQLTNLSLDKINWLILNEVEGSQLTDRTEPEEIIAVIQQKYACPTIVLTLGKYGVICASGPKNVRHGIYRVPVVDTTAAGDTFTGYFLACITNGESVEESLRIASVASSIAISREGAAQSIPTMEEVQTAKLILQV